MFAGRFAEAQALVGEKLMARPRRQMPYGTIGSLVVSRAGAPDAPPPAAAPKGLKSDVTPAEPSRPLPGYRRELDLDAAVAATRWTEDGIAYRREVIASPVDQVIAIRLTAAQGGSLDVDLSLATPLKQTQLLAGRDARDMALGGRNDAANGIAGALRFEARVRVIASDDPSLATLDFNYARYMLVACSRPGSQPANLQGIWNDTASPPWGGKYTININTQMNYWPAEPANLPECVEPLVAMVRDLAVTGARTARVMYGARGWVCHHNTDPWRATAPIDGPAFGMWPAGGAWLCTHLWDHYDYGRDTAYLASVYPLIRDAALFFVDTLRQDPTTGFLVTNPSLSTENNHGHGSSICAGPTMDMAILRDLFAQAAEAAAILGRDAGLARQFLATRDRLAPYRRGRQGQLQEWQADWDGDARDIHHRHVSHLYGVFPGRQIDAVPTPALAAAAPRSLDIRGDEATGWATAWRIALWARLRDGNRAHRILRFLIGPERTCPNLFDAHPPFQIDGNFGGAAASVEMLVSSTPDAITLLPALPDAWPSGDVKGVRGRGGHVVAPAWRDGALTQASITPSSSGSITVRWGSATRTVKVRASEPVHLTRSSFA